jgi:DDE_Tnp_1-associated/Druantia protein DruA
MSVHLANEIVAGLPEEPRLLGEVTLRLITPAERARFDQYLRSEHYLKSARVGGCALRYVAEYQDQWLALMVFSSPAYHLKLRDRWLHWPAREVAQRRHLVAQNSRFLVLASAGRWPNLASRVLKLAGARLSADWQQHFGGPVLAVETFVDPQRFRATCYQAAGWQRLGATQGFERSHQDFYTDTEHPKELWVRALGEDALERLQAAELAPELADPNGPRPPACPVPNDQLNSLWQCLGNQMTEPRCARGLRHKLASILALTALAVVAGCKGPHAICEFAESLSHAQRGQLRCPRRRGVPRQFDVPCERTFRRLFKKVDPEQLKAVVVAWMQARDPAPLEQVHADGKVVRNAQPAPARPQPPQPPDAPSPPCEIPPEQQKPKADKALMLINFHTLDQRLVDQVAVPRDTNEEAALAQHLPQMDLAGVCFIADAAHTTKANCRQLTQFNGADYLLFIKGNQPTALAKAEQLLPGALPPSGQLPGQSPRTH